MKENKDVLGSVVKTAQMGQVGLQSVLAAPLRPRLRDSLERQVKVFDEIEAEGLGLAACRNWKISELGAAGRVASRMMTRMKLMGGSIDSKAAAMVIEGNTKGLVKGTQNLRHMRQQDTAVSVLAQRLLEAERESIRQMQNFL